MSTQKWESITWDWLEREIVDYLMIAGRQRQRRRLLTRLLTQPKARASSVAPTRKQAGERNNG